MSPGAQKVARSLTVIQHKADRLRERDNLPARSAAIGKRAVDCGDRLARAYQRCAVTAWDPPADYEASLYEMRASIRAYRQALYELLAIAWIFAETAPNNLGAAYRNSAIDELQPSRIQRHLGELHHLAHEFSSFVVVDLFIADSVGTLLSEFDRLLGEFDQLCPAA